MEGVMYKLLKIDEEIMTRAIKLINEESGCIDDCFDDSDLSHEYEQDFSFMKIGCIYDCKILLFGNVKDYSEINAKDFILCKYSNEFATIGIYEYLKVETSNGEYYIEKDCLKEIGDKKEFWFRWSRKDLIQVNNVILPRLLR